MKNNEFKPNFNIERTVLSSIIFDPSLLDSDYCDLKIEDFLMDFHKKVFRSMKVLQKVGKPVHEEFIKIELSKESIFNETSFFDIMSSNPTTDALSYKNKLKEISKAQYFKIMKAEILAKDLSAVEEIRELEKLFKNYRKAMVLKPILNIVNSKHVIATEPNFFLRDKFPIQENEINMISAPGGVGKSFVALWAACFLEKEHNLKTFSYLSEDDIGTTKHRLNIIKNTNPEIKNIEIDYAGKDIRPKPFLKKIDGCGLGPSDYFEDFKKSVKDYNVIILDPLIAFIFEDENNNVEARALFNLLNEWCLQDNKTLVIIHHHNKNDVMRGASAFIDAVRVHSTLENPMDADRKKWEEEKKSAEKKGEKIDPFKPEMYNYRIATIKKTNHFSGVGEFKIPLFSEGEPAFEVVYEDWDENVMCSENGGANKFPGADVSEYEMPDMYKGKTINNIGEIYEDVK